MTRPEDWLVAWPCQKFSNTDGAPVATPFCANDESKIGFIRVVQQDAGSHVEDLTRLVETAVAQVNLMRYAVHDLVRLHALEGFVMNVRVVHARLTDAAADSSLWDEELQALLEELPADVI